MTIDGFTAATPVELPTYYSLQITGTEQAVAIGQALEQAVAAGVIAVGTTQVNGNGWQIQVNETFAGPGDYIVYGTNTAGAIVSLQLFNGPSGKYNNELYSGAFQAQGS